MKREQFEGYMNQFKDHVYGLSYSFLKNRSDADDVVQTTFLKLFCSLKKFQSDEHVKNWLLKVAVNECRKQFRIRYREEDQEFFDETLLHLLGALDIPTSGQVELEGKDLSKLKEKELARIRRDKMGFVFQNFSLIKELSVRDNICLPVVLADKQMDSHELMELSETLGMEERLSHMPWELSGGQRQRVAIARALANKPEIFFCDEPTGNLDQKTSQEVMELLHLVHEKYHKTILIVTHDKAIASNTDYELAIEDGRILL